MKLSDTDITDRNRDQLNGIGSPEMYMLINSVLTSVPKQFKSKKIHISTHDIETVS